MLPNVNPDAQQAAPEPARPRGQRNVFRIDGRPYEADQLPQKIVYASAFLPLSSMSEKLREHGEVMPRSGAIPANLYVDVPTIAKQASRLVFLVCLFSLALSIITGVDMIHPFVSIFICLGCIPFYIMGNMLQKTYSTR
jgi:hypothetical protein